jgi:hypothetical protein
MSMGKTNGNIKHMALKSILKLSVLLTGPIKLKQRLVCCIISPSLHHFLIRNDLELCKLISRRYH